MAHSISGNGAIAANVNNDCTEVKNFAAYKVTQSSIGLGSESKENRASAIVSIDVGQGIGIHGGKCGNVLIKDSKVYGELPKNYDCHKWNGGTPADFANCDHCYDRFGLIFASIYEEEHRDREVMNWEWMPLYNYSDCFYGTNGRNGEVTYKNVEFRNYPTATTSCESR